MSNEKPWVNGSGYLQAYFSLKASVYTNNVRFWEKIGAFSHFKVRYAEKSQGGDLIEIDGKKLTTWIQSVTFKGVVALPLSLVVPTWWCLRRFSCRVSPARLKNISGHCLQGYVSGWEIYLKTRNDWFLKWFFKEMCILRSLLLKPQFLHLHEWRGVM